MRSRKPFHVSFLYSTLICSGAVSAFGLTLPSGENFEIVNGSLKAVGPVIFNKSTGATNTSVSSTQPVIFLGAGNNNLGTGGGSNVGRGLLVGESNSLASDVANTAGYGLVLGYNNTARVYGSAVVGSGNTVSAGATAGSSFGKFTSVFGKLNVVNSGTDGSYASLVFGGENELTGDYTLVGGRYNTVGGQTVGSETLHAVALGYNNLIASGKGWTIGSENSVTGLEASAFGSGLKVDWRGAAALGTFNAAPFHSGSATSYIDQAPLLVIGNGTSDAARSNALVLSRSGDLDVWGGKLTMRSPSGTPGVTLHSSTGAVTLSGSASGIYNSAGGAVLGIDGQGSAVFPSRTKFEDGVDFGDGGQLNAGNVGYLQDLLGNLGYQENPITPTVLKRIPLEGNVSAPIFASRGGSVYLTGYYDGAIKVGNHSHSPQNYESGIFFAKCSPLGVVEWIKFISSSVYFSPVALAVDGAGSPILAANLNGTTTGLGAGHEISSGTSDGVVIKFDANGNTLWSKAIGGSSNDYDSISGVAVDGSGNVFVGGSFAGTTTTIGGGLDLTSSGPSDGYLAKLTSGGVFQWTKAIGGSLVGDTVRRISTDPNGDVVVVGGFRGTTTTFGQGKEVTSVGPYTNAYYARLDGQGATQWTNSSTATFNDVAVDALGNSYIAGYYSGNVSIPGWGALASVGSSDGFAMKVNNVGVVQWARSIGGALTDAAYEIATNGAGQCVVGGMFQETTTTLGGGKDLVGVGGNNRAFIVTFDAAGTAIFSQETGYSVRSVESYESGFFVSGESFNRFSLGDTKVLDRIFLVGWEGAFPITPSVLAPVSFSWNGGLASGQGSIASGREAFASGKNSVSFGGGSAIGELSFASNRGTASGYGAFSSAGGKAKGDYSFATGSGIAEGWGAVASGSSLAKGENSVAMGQGALALGSSSAAFGVSTRADAWGSFAAGYMNHGGVDPNDSNLDPIFEIGNGDEGPSNAISTQRNGRTTIGNKFWRWSADPLELLGWQGSGDGEALVVDGHTRLRGRVVIEQPQGDISMGIFE